MDCKPDSASTCFAPTSNPCTFLQWLDKIQFIGGAGDPSSHIVEGLSTAINVLDDFSVYREKFHENCGKSSKYCILICNSTPYLEPSCENAVYCGYTIDQLTNLMAEKGINFSIFSPRKINFLYKLFENAGGNLNSALMKNFAKDRRHLVLLNGFCLKEKPVSPNPSISASTNENQSQAQGVKRPASPSPVGNQQTALIARNQLLSNDGSQSQFAQNTKPMSNEANAFQANSPSLNPQWTNNATNVVSPQQPNRNGHHVRPRAPTPQMQNVNMNTSAPSPMANNIPAQNVAQQNKLSPVNQNNSQLRPNMNQMRPQQQSQQIQSPFSVPQPSPSQPSPLGVRPVPSPASNSVPSPVPQPPVQPNMSGLHSGQRTRIWSGIIEYQDKTQPPSANGPYMLECQITYQPNNSEPEFTMERWPDKITIYLCPKLLMNRLSPIFKNDSHQVNFIFNNSSPGLDKLIAQMSASTVCNRFVFDLKDYLPILLQAGFIHMPGNANTRIIIVSYYADKK